MVQTPLFEGFLNCSHFLFGLLEHPHYSAPDTSPPVAPLRNQDVFQHTTTSWRLLRDFSCAQRTEDIRRGVGGPSGCFFFSNQQQHTIKFKFYTYQKLCCSLACSLWTVITSHTQFWLLTFLRQARKLHSCWINIIFHILSWIHFFLGLFTPHFFTQYKHRW